MSSRTSVLLWAQRINGMKKTAQPHQLLDIDKAAGLDAAQDAFHKIARMAHPDLHRSGLDADELELVTSAYAAVANAYQTFRGQTTTTTKLKPVGGGEVPITPSGAPPAPTGVAGAMSSRALVYYRKAELCLKRGDLRGAMLQLKMAIGTDPASTFLRTALHEVEAEVHKGT